MSYDVVNFCITEIGKVLNFPVLYWKKENNVVTKRKHGVVLYERPKQNVYTEPHKSIQLQRQLCITAYR